MTTAISLSGVSKRYVLGNDPLLISRLIPRKRKALEEIWALREVSFEIEHGETVAIVGTNGSGKTTSLRLMAGVSAPTSGRLRVNGRVAPLIGVGVGFNPELTGRENVFVNGRLLGISSERLKREFDRIVEFSEMEEFLDTPVKFYSTGMFLRLGFAVAVHTYPEILVVDEILAVGDAAFQAKCNQRMTELREAGTTVVLVTHNTNLAVRIAPRTIVLSRGEVAFDGDSVTSVGVYHSMLSEIRDINEAAPNPTQQNAGDNPYGPAEVTIDMADGDGQRNRGFKSGEPLTVTVEVKFTDEVVDPCIGIAILPAEGHDVVASVFTDPGEYKGRHGPDRPLIATVQMENHMATRSYTIHADVYDSQRKWMIGSSRRESFYVKSVSRYFGLVDGHSRLSINGEAMNGLADR